MATVFRIDQRNSAPLAESRRIIRSCVHCGFCTATCPTYLLLGDECDSPRGRIYMMKEMLETGGPPSPVTVKHVDRCLSCLSCMTTCPSDVDYMHLVDHARAHIEANYRRPWPDRMLRALLAAVLPRPMLFRLALTAARFGRPFRALAPGRLRGLLDMAPRDLPRSKTAARPGIFPAEGVRRGRVALLAGCAQSVMAPQINAAAVRLLNRLGFEVTIASQAGCCGALPHHLGKVDASHALAQANIAAWTDLEKTEPLDAIVITTSGCGTTIKDYGHMFRDDPEWADRAARISALARDVSEVLPAGGVSALARPIPLKVAYHSACSLQHGQGVRQPPRTLLSAAGFEVVEPAESHICCGSAGTYNLLQPEIAGRLGARKAENLAATGPDVIASGNLGCISQIGGATPIPVVHTVELLDWATGGPAPAGLDAVSENRT